MKKSSGNGIKLFIIAIVMIALIVGYYFHLSNKTKEVKEVTAITEVDELLLRNLSTNYPPSPKEVVKLYAQITKCFYDGQYSEEELSDLAVKSRELLDDELRATQTDESYLASLKADISSYAQNDMHISSYSTSSSVDVDYYTVRDREMAKLYCLYNIRQGSKILTSNHQYILRKDASGHWKILGWTLVAKDEQ